MKQSQPIIEQAWLQTKTEVPEAFQNLDRRKGPAKHLYNVAQQEFLFILEELAIKWFEQEMCSYLAKRR